MASLEQAWSGCNMLNGLAAVTTADLDTDGIDEHVVAYLADAKTVVTREWDVRLLEELQGVVRPPAVYAYQIEIWKYDNGKISLAASAGVYAFEDSWAMIELQVLADNDDSNRLSIYAWSYMGAGRLGGIEAGRRGTVITAGDDGSYATCAFASLGDTAGTHRYSIDGVEGKMGEPDSRYNAKFTALTGTDPSSLNAVESYCLLGATPDTESQPSQTLDVVKGKIEAIAAAQD